MTHRVEVAATNSPDRRGDEHEPSQATAVCRQAGGGRPD